MCCAVYQTKNKFLGFHGYFGISRNICGDFLKNVFFNLVYISFCIQTINDQGGASTGKIDITMIVRFYNLYLDA